MNFNNMAAAFLLGCAFIMGVMDAHALIELVPKYVCVEMLVPGMPYIYCYWTTPSVTTELLMRSLTFGILFWTFLTAAVLVSDSETH